MCTHHTAPTGHNEALQNPGGMDSEAQGQGGSFLKQRHYDKMNGNKRQFHMNITNCITEHLEWAHLKQQPVAHYSWNCIRQRQNMESWKIVGRNVLNLFLEINCCNNQQIKSESEHTSYMCAVLFLEMGVCWDYKQRRALVHICVCMYVYTSVRAVSVYRSTLYSSVKAAGCQEVNAIFLCHDTGKSNHPCSLKCVVRSKAVKFHEHRS